MEVSLLFVWHGFRILGSFRGIAARDYCMPFGNLLKLDASSWWQICSLVAKYLERCFGCLILVL